MTFTITSDQSEYWHMLYFARLTLLDAGGGGGGNPPPLSHFCDFQKNVANFYRTQVSLGPIYGFASLKLPHKQRLTGSGFLLRDRIGSGSDKNFG